MSINEPESYDAIKWKAGLLIFVFGFAFSIVLGRLFWVQVVDGAHYRELAKKQYESKVELRAERGKIYDREMRDLASMMKTTSFAADPTLLQNASLCSELLAVAVGDPASFYLEKIRSAEGRFVWLARGVNTVMYPVLDTLKDRGLIRVKEPKRHFTYGPIAAQIIGTTDIDNNGLTGLELQYDALLRGKGGFVVMQRDGRGRLRPGVDPERESPTDGHGLQLTIDVEIQRIAEQELLRGVRENGAASGSVVAVNPATGEILAMASVPTFDPNRLDATTNDAIRIRAITDQYEPGSTMKAITAAALLEERKLAPNDKVDGMKGTWNIPGGVIRDDHPMGIGTFHEAMEQSSNVVFASSAKLLDDRVYYKYVRDFGFGIPTGIDLPGEIRGRLKRPDQFDVNTKAYMAHGYEMSATAIQMLTAYATIANNGLMMQPHVVRAFVSPSGKILKEVAPQTVRRVISEPTAKLLTQMLVGVVEKGTGQAARISGVSIAGKTGTAQQLADGSYSKKAYTASFVGFFPAENPRVAMIVMLDRPSASIYGGATAAPIFRRIVQKTMTMLRLDAQTQSHIAESSKSDSVSVPDLRGLDGNVAKSTAQRIGLRVEFDTTAYGYVIGQHPAIGTLMEKGEILKVKILPHHSTAHPNVVGFPMRRAVTVLHASGYEVVIRGTGHVVKQEWANKTCTIYASD